MLRGRRQPLPLDDEQLCRAREARWPHPVFVPLWPASPGLCPSGVNHTPVSAPLWLAGFGGGIRPQSHQDTVP